MAFSVLNFGAKGDNQNNDQQAIQDAVDTCHKRGGGRVAFPPGQYLTGSIKLKSGVELHLETGAMIQGIQDSTLYPILGKMPNGNLPGQIQALFWAENAENISITGQGIIDGGGNSPLNGEVAARTFFRPTMIFFQNCHQVRFLDVRLQYSCFWTLHVKHCNDVLIRGLSIEQNLERINTDGIDPDGSTDVRISDCHIVSCDDSICIKSTEGEPAENITITNCILSSRHAALKIGTESIGNVRNITVSNCIIRDSNVGLAMYMKDGSTYENIQFNNIVMECYGEYPIIIDNRPRYYREPRKGIIRNIVFNSITMTGKGRIFIEGLPEFPIHNLLMRNIICNITENCDYENATLPSGARRMELDPQSVNYARKPYHFIGVCLKNSVIENLALNDVRKGKVSERKALYLNQVKQLTVSYSSNLKTSTEIPEVAQTECVDIKLVKR